MATSISGSEISEGPVLTVLSKRLRALKKKLNRIQQLESASKALNKEQTDLVASKPFVVALVDELDKLRQPLANAVAEEISKIQPFPSRDEELSKIQAFPSRDVEEVKVVAAVEVSPVEDQEEQPKVDVSEDVPNEIKDPEQENGQAIEISLEQSSPVNESPKDEVIETNPPSEQVTTVHQENQKLSIESEEQDKGDINDEEEFQEVRGRKHRSQTVVGGRFGGRRGGRGGGGPRGRRGGGQYQNGRSSQQYYESGNYPRNNDTRGRGGGRSGGSHMNGSNHVAPTQNGHADS